MIGETILAGTLTRYKQKNNWRDNVGPVIGIQSASWWSVNIGILCRLLAYDCCDGNIVLLYDIGPIISGFPLSTSVDFSLGINDASVLPVLWKDVEEQKMQTLVGRREQNGGRYLRGDVKDVALMQTELFASMRLVGKVVTFSPLCIGNCVWRCCSTIRY